MVKDKKSNADLVLAGLAGHLIKPVSVSAVLLAMALTGRADGNPAGTLKLSIAPPGIFNEFSATPQLEWNVEPARTYLVQSATNLSPETVWKTEESVRAATNGPIKWMSPEALRSQKYYRLILPQPEVSSVEPAFVNSDDPAALFYLIGQCFPTNGSVVINGLNFTPTLVDSNGGWMAISLNGLPPGTPVFGNILVLDNSSNIVTTLPLQNPVIYGTELTAEQLQGPPDEPPASPDALLVAWFSKRGYDYYKARSDFNAASLHQNPYFQENNMEGAMPVSKKGYDYYQAGSSSAFEVQDGKKGLNAVNVKLASRSGGGVDEDCDGLNPDFSLLMPALMKAKEKANRTKANNRMQPATGEIQLDEVDLVIPGVGLDFVWTRTYRSRAEVTTAQGAGWDFCYNVSATSQPDGTVVLRPGNGRADTFYPNGTNGWTRDEYFLHLRDVDQDGAPDEVVFPDGGKWTLHPPGTAFAGKLAEIVDRNNNTIRCEYDNDTGRLLRVVDTLDRTNTVAYTSKGLIESVTDFSGRTVRYEYDSAADLIACISPAVIGTPNGNDFPGGKTNRYAYSSGNLDQRLNHNLLSITDPKGQVCLEVTYQATNNPTSLDFDAVSSMLRGVDKKDIRRGMVIARPSNSFATVQTIVNDYVGNVTEYLFDSRHRCVSVREFTGRANPALPTTAKENRPIGKLRAEDPDFFETQWTWNPDSLCTSETRPGGDSTECVYQRAYNQNSARSNNAKAALHHGDLRVVRERASSPVDLDGDGIGDTSELVWRYEYDPRFGSPATASRVMIHKIHNAPESNLQARKERKDMLQWYAETASGNARWQFQPEGTKGVRLGIGVTAVGATFTSPGGMVSGRKGNTSIGASFGGIHRMTDPRGSVTTAEYDSHGNCTKSIKQGHYAVSNFHIEVDRAYNSHGQLTAITNAPDANGYRRVDTFSYYTSGSQRGMVEVMVASALAGGLSLTTAFEYDPRGNVTRIVDPRGNDTLFTYNAFDQLVRCESPTNLTARCVTDCLYDENGNLVQNTTELRSETDTLVRKVDTFCAYDVLDRCTSVVGQIAKGQYATNRFVYDGNGNLVAVHSPLAVAGIEPNNLTQFEYDERGLIFREIAAPGSGNSPTNEYSYDPNGRLRSGVIAEVGAGRPATVGRYNGFGQLTDITDPMSNVVSYRYDRNGNLTLVRHYGELNDEPGSAGNRLLAETRYAYDSLDRCVQQVDSFFDVFTLAAIGDGAATTTFAYAPNGACISVTDDNGHTTSFGYDTAGRLASVASPGGRSTTVSVRDQLGNVTSLVTTDQPDGGGAAQQFARGFSYDAFNRCVADWDNAGNTNRYAYDSLGRCVSHLDPRENESLLVFDDLGRCITNINYQGKERGITINTSHVEYDTNSRRIASTDANGNTTRFAYDSLDRLLETMNPDGTHCSLVWSPRSNLVREQDPNGNVISNGYDLLDRCIARDITPGPTVATTTTFERYAYDGLSRLAAATNDASHSELAYDSMGNCVRGTSGGVGAVVRAHDGVGNRLSLTYPSGRLVTYTYDALDQVASVSSSAGGGLPPVALATYAYEGPGRLGKVSRANGIDTRFQWNGKVNPANAAGDFGWLQVSGVNHQGAGNGAIIDRRISAYDRNQNKTVRAQVAPFFIGGLMTTNLFAYDALDRLTQFSRASGSPADLIRAYNLDGNGNRLLGSSNGVAAPYVMDNTFPDPADFQMNQYTLTPFVLAPEQYDTNGNLVFRVSTTAQLAYQYDYADRLVSVANLSGGFPEPVASYAYDALGQRRSKTIFPSGLPPVTTEFVYDWRDDDCDGDIIEERVNGVLTRTYVLPQVGDEVLVAFDQAGQPQFYHHDELGNTLALTGASGNVIERCDYDDFGAPIFLSPDGIPTGEAESGVGNPYLFHGLEWDGELGFYHRNGGGRFDPQTAKSINGNMPNRISMNATVPKQTQGATFGEKVNQGLHAAGGALAQGRGASLGWGGGGAGGLVRSKQSEAKSNSKAMFTAEKGRVKFFNEAKGFGFIKEDGGAEGFLLKKEEGGRHTPFHNKYRPQFRTAGGGNFMEEVSLKFISVELK